MSSQANFKNFDPDVDCDDDSYPIQDVQHLYRVTNSFGEALRKIEMFGQGLRKPIETIYNEKTKNIEYNRNI